MNKSKKKSFIPKDKPKSWIIFIISVLSGLLIASPIMILGYFLDLSFLRTFGTTLSFLCVAVGIFFWFVMVINSMKGKHNDISEKKWNEQVW